MRTILLVITLCAICTGSAFRPVTASAAPDSTATRSKLVARHAEVADILVASIEGKSVHGQLMLKPMLRGEQMTLLELHLQPGTKAPLHTHAHESLIYVVSGQVKTWIGDEVYILGPGDAARHPPGVLHTVEALVESTIVEIKSPAPDIANFMGTGKRP